MSPAFAGKVVLVTGASSGIGAELARQFSAAGAKVALMARDVAHLEDVAAECRARGADALVVPGDVSVEASCRDAVEKTVAHFGRLDVLVNNAGLRAHGRFDAITDYSIFERLLRVNFLGGVWCTGYALPYLRQSRGQVIAVASLSGLAGLPERSAYGASKHAMAGFFDALRVELQDSGVAVTVIYPGFVLSPSNRPVMSADGSTIGDAQYKRRASEAMTAEACARRILRAAEAREREVIMTWRGKVGRILRMVSPSLLDRMARSAMKRKK